MSDPRIARSRASRRRRWLGAPSSPERSVRHHPVEPLPNLNRENLLRILDGRSHFRVFRWRRRPARQIHDGRDPDRDRQSEGEPPANTRTP
jgi:hypothetical protein